MQKRASTGWGLMGPSVVVICLGLGLLGPGAAAAGPEPMGAGPMNPGPMDRQALPDPLKDWVGWALYGKDAGTCPMVHGEADASRCHWPSRLELRLDARGGQFVLELHQHAVRWSSSISPRR